MSAEIVNLRQARKAKARATHSAEGAANRAAHGRSRHDREVADQARDIASRRLDGHRLQYSDGDDAPIGPGNGDAP